LIQTTKFWFIGAALSIDVDLSESEQVFESQFKKRYGDKESEQRAAAALAASEKEVCGLNC
jgi:hypothetical protein